MHESILGTHWFLGAVPLEELLSGYVVIDDEWLLAEVFPFIASRTTGSVELL